MRFYSSRENLHLELAISCLRIMNNGLKQNLLSLPDYALNSEVEDLQTRIDNCSSIALQYACKSWHSHLTKTTTGVDKIIPDLHFFLERKLLAWLEVTSALGVMKGVVVALEELKPWLQKVGFGHLFNISCH